MRSILLPFFALLFLATPGSGQGGYVAPKIPEKVQKQFDEAVLTSKAGHLDGAIITLLEIIKRFPTWQEPRHELSRIYYEAGKKNESISTLEFSVAIDTQSQLKQLYTLARLYEETSQVDKAKTAYHTFIAKSDPHDPLRYKSQDALDKFDERQKMMKRKYDIHLIPFPNEINTENHESVGRWTLDGREMLFARVVGGQEDLYIGRLDSATQLWKVDPFPFNTEQNEGAPSVSPDGKYLVFTSCNRPDGLGSCDLYISVKKNGLWTRPVNMGAGFNSPSWDGQPCFGLDGMTLYFSSNRAGGFGGRDIWYMIQTSADSWSRPASAGPGINTAFNEGSPFIYFDGNTMYFMRDGTEGLGDNDLYISRKAIDGKWQKGENMGAPINSPEGEGALAIHPNGKRAMITRLTPEQKNDLFEFDLPADFTSIPQQQLNVSIRDKSTGLPLRGQLEIYEPSGDPSIRLSQWANEAGQIVTAINQRTTYAVIANSPGYLMYSVHLNSDSAAIRKLDIQMIPITKSKNEAIVLENVFFETGSAALLPSSETELQKLLYTLKTNQPMQIEIRGHTDDVGDEASNQQLSQDRAKSVYMYLLNKGIAAERLAYKGYGESQPVADNLTETGRQKNRRTEFYILKN